MLISKRARSAYLSRPFDDFSWMKKLSKQQLLDEVCRLDTLPEFKTEPWKHQLVCFWIGLCYPRFTFLLDMGAGKTKILLDIITQLKREGRLTKKALVFVPRLINLGSWGEDIVQHSDLKSRLIQVSNIEAKWEALRTTTEDVAVIDYQGFCLAMTSVKKNKRQIDPKKVKELLAVFDFFGLDESHKLSNQESLWYRLIHQVTERATFVYATTGTLFGEDPLPAWSQFLLVDEGETFGQQLGLFRAAFYDEKAGPWKKEFVFKKKMLPVFNSMLRHRSIRYNEREFSDVPAERYQTIRLSMGAEQREHYLKALDKLITTGDGSFVEMDNSYVRMRMLCGGYAAWKDEYGEHSVFFKENPKLQALAMLLDEAPDEKFVVSTEYTLSGKVIADYLTAEKIPFVWLHGEAKGDRLEMRERFMKDPDCRVFLMQSTSGGTGVDGLQKVSKRLVFYESPTHPTNRRQVLKRIVRPGQREHSFIYDLVIRGSVDAGILEDVLAGIDFYSKAVDGKSATRLQRLLAADC